MTVVGNVESHYEALRYKGAGAACRLSDHRSNVNQGADTREGEWKVGRILYELAWGRRGSYYRSFIPAQEKTTFKCHDRASANLKSFTLSIALLSILPH
jgi:hypothetical protein